MQRSITWRGDVAGELGGFIGSWVMNEFQDGWSAAEKRISKKVVHHRLGTAMSFLYGALTGKTPKARACSGTLFATSVWLGADEIAVPALKLSPPPVDSPIPTHILSHMYGWASHLIYGLTLEGSDGRFLRPFNRFAPDIWTIS